jgi:AraC-like DNA-binding protein
MDESEPLPVGESPLRQVLLCDLYHRPPGHAGVAHSLPGHLIQLTIEGRTEHEVEGRHYLLEPGSLLWYHEVEQVRLRVLDRPWSFYTLNFIAESLQPPPFEERVRKIGRDVGRHFPIILAAWRDTATPPLERRFRVHAAVNALLGDLLSDFNLRQSQAFEMDEAARLWWEVEQRLRQNLGRPMTLTQLAQLAGRSPATLARACHAAVGLPPMKRLKQIRMNLARGLTQCSQLRIKEIAQRVGYERLHEFSRDYHKLFGLSPRQDRDHGPIR